MPVTYTRAEPNILDLVYRIRDDHHQALKDQDARFCVLMRDTAAKRGGKAVLGTAKKASAKDCTMLGEDVQFILTFAADEWSLLTGRQKTALVDHELSHCAVEVEVSEDGAETVKWRTVTHDIEEFTKILERHGAWTEHLEEAVRVIQQLDLFAPVAA